MSFVFIRLEIQSESERIIREEDANKLLKDENKLNTGSLGDWNPIYQALDQGDDHYPPQTPVVQQHRIPSRIWDLATPRSIAIEQEYWALECGFRDN